MESSYPKELAARIEKRSAEKRRKDVNAVAFLAVRADVKAAIDAGYSVSTIYEDMHEIGRVKSTYETFRQHVLKYIKAAPAVPQPTPAAAGKPNTPTRADRKGGKVEKPAPAGITGFNFNPKPNKEDLL